MDRSPVLKCRSCTSVQLKPIIDFGLTPLANNLLYRRDGYESRYPLELVRCDVCELVQITHTVPPEQLFSHYLYFSSCSPPLVESAKALAHRLIKERKLDGNSLVIEAASNDGYLLQHYQERSIRVLGIEPAANVAEVARENRITTCGGFFGSELAKWIAETPIYGQCDVFHANNVLPHVADLNGFVAGIKRVLKPDGIAVIECSDVNCMFEQTQFDFIYHEHLCYFSPTSLFFLFRRHDLEIAAIERIPVHGGSLRVFVRHPQAYALFGWEIGGIKVALKEMIRDKRVAGYGAAAKGAMLLHHCGINTLEFVCDATPAKQGKFMPGVRTPIVHPEELTRRQPDYCLILAWNYADQIMGNEHGYEGKWIIPIPVVRCVDSQYQRRHQSDAVHRGDPSLDIDNPLQRAYRAQSKQPYGRIR